VLGEDGKKMSKSLGNLYTLDDLRAKGFSPAALRYALLSGHPRKQLNFTLDSLHAAESALKHLRAFRTQLTPAGTEDPFAPIFTALNDDLNTAGAFGALFTIVNKGAASINPTAFDRVLFALGLDLTETVAPKADIPADIAALAEKRWAAKQSKDFATADALRKDLTAAGWTMLDRKDGYELKPESRS
jgi:cysteinyl-tRNA synthetase